MSQQMKIVVASGKGGTGKTTIATSMAVSLASLTNTRYLDCDVEAPNGHLFLDVDFVDQHNVNILIPQIQTQLCTGCGKCVDVCQFHALAIIGKKVMVFPQLCHGCGSCTLNCPEGAILESPHPIGEIKQGVSNRRGFEYFQGILTISEPMATPIIRQLKKQQDNQLSGVEIYDAPPGAACSAVEALRNCDYAVLVTEPTPFGLHDLKQIFKITEEMGIPAGVIVNRDEGNFQPLNEFCSLKNLPIIKRIPFDRKIAEGISQGKLLIDVYPAYEGMFIQIFNEISKILSRNKE